jgi:hypothetical protein
MYIGQNDVIHVAWLSDGHIEGEQHYMYSYSTDGGATFSDDEQVTEVGFDRKFTRPGDYFCMRQEPVTGDMCMVWTDGREGNTHDIYFARQGLVLFPKWAIISIAGVTVLLIASVVYVILLRIRR